MTCISMLVKNYFLFSLLKFLRFLKFRTMFIYVMSRQTSRQSILYDSGNSLLFEWGKKDKLVSLNLFLFWTSILFSPSHLRRLIIEWFSVKIIRRRIKVGKIFMCPCKEVCLYDIEWNFVLKQMFVSFHWSDHKKSSQHQSRRHAISNKMGKQFKEIDSTMSRKNLFPNISAALAVINLNTWGKLLIAWPYTKVSINNLHFALGKCKFIILYDNFVLYHLLSWD